MFNKFPVIFLYFIFISSFAQAQSSELTVSGKIKAAACEVNPDSRDFIVYMKKHNTTEFQQVGDSTSPVSFNISLTKCPATTSRVLIKLDGIADAYNPQLIRLDENEGNASGIGIAVYDSTGKIIPLWTPSSYYSLQQGDNILSFTARYVASRLPVSAGVANATSDFTLNYQ